MRPSIRSLFRHYVGPSAHQFVRLPISSYFCSYVRPCVNLFLLPSIYSFVCPSVRSHFRFVLCTCIQQVLPAPNWDTPCSKYQRTPARADQRTPIIGAITFLRTRPTLWYLCKGCFLNCPVRICQMRSTTQEMPMYMY